MKKETKRRPDIGGQAVLEGVMMKAPDYMAIAVRRESGDIVVKREIISYTGTTATTFTGCTRATGGTTAAAFGSGTLVEQVPVAANHNDLAAAIVALETMLGAYGNAVALGDPIINGHFKV